MQRIWRKGAILGIACVLGLAGPASATWSSIFYTTGDGSSTHSATVMANVNGGADTDGYAYTSIKPGSGDWTASYDMRAWISTLNVWSATNIWFQPWNFARGGASDGGQIVLKINLSEPISGATWIAPGMDGNYLLTADYSTDGSNWTTAWDYYAGHESPTVQTLSISPTSSLYVRLNSSTWFNTGGSGAFTFTAVPEPMTMGFLAIGATTLIRRRMA